MREIMIRLARTAALAFLAATAVTAMSQSLKETPAEKAKRMQWFREARFGMFIHWGLYAIPAGEWNGRTNHGEWILETAQIPLEQYTPFQKQFNPVKFDADRWVLAAKNAGMKYIVITSKHHEGFALFDSALTDWDIMGTPFKRDIMAELADACRRHGLKICWYHSIMDWHHPDYLPRRSWEKRPADEANFRRFVDYLRGQVTELLTKYGDIGIMWFDGEWESTWNHEDGQALYDLCRKLQPNVIVNNRVDIGRSGMAGFTEGDGFAGDYGTPEQEIPETGIPGVDWETCMTMNNTWGYSKHDRNWKSAPQMVRMLCDIASKGGNYLLNIGPTAEGEFPPESIERLTLIGEWMSQYGDSIYGTSASPIKAPSWGRITVKPKSGKTSVYLHVFDWPTDGKLILRGLGNKIESAQRMGSAGLLSFESEIDRTVIHVDSATGGKDLMPVVIHVTMQGEPIPLVEPEFDAVTDIFLDSISIPVKTASDKIVVRYTLDGSVPVETSPRLTGPVSVDKTTTMKLRGFFEGRPIGETVSRTFTKVNPRPSVVVSEPQPGILARDYSGTWSKLPDFDKLVSIGENQTSEIGLGPLARREYVGRSLRGYLSVPADGIYTIELGSDDGSRLWIGGEVAIDHDGLHGFTTKRTTAALAKGYHAIRIDWFNQTGGAELRLRWARVGENLVEVPAERLAHSR